MQPASTTAARLVPEWPLPHYAFVPGKFPHPRRDPGNATSSLPDFDRETHELGDWRRCRTYLFGIELFNHGYYWEAHEAWESLWHAAGRHGELADFLKGLIALAAAGVKARQGRQSGVRDHAERARTLFRQLAHPPSTPEARFFGLRLQSLLEASHAIASDPEGLVDTSDALVVRVMPFQLVISGLSQPDNSDSP